jgi:hypothetical protein
MNKEQVQQVHLEKCLLINHQDRQQIAIAGRACFSISIRKLIAKRRAEIFFGPIDFRGEPECNLAILDSSDCIINEKLKAKRKRGSA